MPNVGLWVAQSGSTVVLRYNEDAESILEQAKTVAGNVEGATGVKAEKNT